MIETNRIEFKRELTRELDIEKEVVAFLNYREGGIIYIGMDDEGKPVGVKDIDGDMLKIKDRIRMGILPLVSGCSRPRNREIMRIFKDVDLVEQLGTGMNRMMKVYTPDIFVVSPNFFHTVFNYNKLSDNFGKDFGKGFIKDLTKELADRQQIILEILSANPAFSARAISEKISEKVSVSERTIENDLAVLKKYGLIRRIGGRKEGYWQVLI